MTTQLKAGRPVWMDLMTHDTEGAKAFYRDLFGWTFTDQGEDFGHYHLIDKDGVQVGGLMSSLMSEQGPTDEPTAPTAWNVYLHTDDVTGTVGRLGEVGAQVVFGPMDVADHGRQAFVVDPAGAHLGLWEPKQMQGFELSMAMGTPVWFETLSKDLDAALPFYRDLLGWDIAWLEGPADEPAAGFRYATNGAGEQAVAGLCDASKFLPPEVPSFWRVYFAVPDADAAVARITELGGSVHSQPEDSPFGRFAQVADPQGGVFMINQEPSVGGRPAD